MEREYILQEGKPYYVFNEKKYYGIFNRGIYTSACYFIGMVLDTPSGECRIMFINPAVYKKTNALNQILFRVLKKILPEDAAKALSIYL